MDWFWETIAARTESKGTAQVPCGEQGSANTGSLLDEETPPLPDVQAVVLRMLCVLLYQLTPRLKCELAASLLSMAGLPLQEESGDPSAGKAWPNRHPETARALMRGMPRIAKLYQRLAISERAVAELFAADIVQAVETLQKIVARDPASVQIIAAGRYWPLMISRHYPSRADVEALAERIRLGQVSPIRPVAADNWKPDTPINDYLTSLLVKERRGDGRPLTQESVPYYLDEVLMPYIDEVAAEVGGWENYPEFRQLAQQAAKRGKSGVQRSEVRGRVKKALSAMAARS